MAYEPKTWLTTGSGGTADGDPQADPDASFGKYRSSTEVSLTIGNLWTNLTLGQLANSTTYRCVCLTNANVTDELEECRLMAADTSTLISGMTVKFAAAAFDDVTAFESIANETTAPSSSTIFTPFESTGVPNTDWGSARKLGALNGYLNTTDITADEDTRIFLFIELTCLNVDANSFDGANNKFGIRVVGADT